MERFMDEEKYGKALGELTGFLDNMELTKIEIKLLLMTSIDLINHSNQLELAEKLMK